MNIVATLEVKSVTAYADRERVRFKAALGNALEGDFVAWGATPEVEIVVENPVLLGQFRPGQLHQLHIVPVPDAPTQS